MLVHEADAGDEAMREVLGVGDMRQVLVLAL
jgi:hypothetical protein